MRLTSLADYAVVMMAAAARHPPGARLSATSLAGETGVPLPEISLADIVEAVEGPIGMTTCVDSTRHDCALEGACQVRPHMGVVNGAIRGALASVSLQSLAAELRS